MSKIMGKELVGLIKRKLVPYIHNANQDSNYESLNIFSAGMKTALRLTGFIVTDQHWRLIVSETYCVCPVCMKPLTNAEAEKAYRDAVVEPLSEVEREAIINKVIHD